MSKLWIDEEVEKYTIEIRRFFHQYPELSNGEVNTQRRICEELDKMGIPYECLPAHHVIGILQGKAPGKSIALRGDIDALPMQEKSGLSFASRYDGVAHTCGHDCHAAMLLGAAKYLASHRENYSGRVYLCFQGAEEIAGYGAKEIVPYLKSIGGADHSLGLHVEPMLNVGALTAKPGPRSAGSIGFKATIFGRSGHGSRPDRCLDPILPACEAIQKISFIPANRCCALNPLAVNVAQITSGYANNAIPETAFFQGTVRFFDPKLLETVLPLIRRMIEGTAESYGERAEVEFEVISYPVINSQKGSALAEKIVSEIDGFSMGEFDPEMGSDDFADFSTAFSGVYALLGSNGDPATQHPLHHPQLMIDEDCLKFGVEFTVRYVMEYLNQYADSHDHP